MMRPVRRDLPSGTVTFVFTDVEGSTRLLHELGAVKYAEELAEHRRVIREASARHDGVEVDTQGDAFFFAFPTAPGALSAAGEMSEALMSGPIQVRIGLHTGTPLLTEEGYVGGDVHRAARIAAAGHGGQVLVSSSTAQLVELELTDLGEHRLKDLSASERIFQLGDGEYPALKSLYRTNLPIPSTPFLGRERELQEVVALLSEKDGRLLTLTGPGGTGKTRLAAQAAGLATDDYPDGVWWVPLAPLRDPRLVLETAAQAVGSKNGLAEHIADKSMLLLFDNFEQVAKASPDVASLLVACSNLNVLVTSREPLHVTGEQEYPVPPLVHEEGVAFFLVRARAVKPDFQPDEAVSEICRRLDDLPLALELAAARVKALSSPQILERLDERLPLLTGGARDLPERQRTLRATIQWSYDLLDENERRLFGALSVFAGGCTLDAAEEVAEADLDTLQSLVEKSLLRFSNERYWMLETIREYALERLEEAGEAGDHRDRHARLFSGLAEKAAQVFEGKEQAKWLERLTVEHDNFRAALQHLVISGAVDLELRLVAAMWNLWFNLGHWEEARRALEHALASSSEATADRVKVLLGVAWFDYRKDGDIASSRRLGEEALGLSRELGDGVLEARSLRQLALAAQAEGDHEQATDLLEEAARLSRSIGDLRGVGSAANNLAHIPLLDGDYARAADLFDEALSVARQLGNELHRVGALLNLGQAERGLHDYCAATTHLTESLSLARDIGIREVIVEALYALAAVAAGMDDAERAATLIGAAQGQADFGHVLEEFERRQLEGTVETIRMSLGEEDFERAVQTGGAMSLESAVEYAVGDARSNDGQP